LATGIPKLRAGVSSAAPVLQYDGKVPVECILNHPGAQLCELWRSDSATENLLVFGDNLRVLRALISEYRGKVRLVYIDPPFATGMRFQSRSLSHAYDDMEVDAKYAEFLRQRLILLRELLAEDGSIYLHLDQRAVFIGKLLMDEVFGPTNFRAFITRRKCNPKNYTRKTYGNVSDHILFYSKTGDYVWNRPVEVWTEERALKEYQYVDQSGRRYKKVPVHAPGVRRGATGQPWRGMLPPPGKHWQYPPDVLDEMDRQGLIYWSPNGNPRRKVYLDESSGVAVQDMWLDFRDPFNQNHRITGYPTEKNEQMLARIVAASSNRGDVVLDCFAGSGTTLAAAHSLGRRWIGVDNSVEAMRATLQRFSVGPQRMGDYVQARKTKQPRQVPLLGPQATREPDGIRPCPWGFRWMAEVDQVERLTPLIFWWRKVSGEDAVSGAEEDGMYRTRGLRAP
jgi:adenine-specific DNA-methyltransferase